MRIRMVHVFLGIWHIYILLSPFYLFESGLPQIGDFAMTVLLGVLLISNRIQIPARYQNLWMLLGAFVLDVIMVSCVWTFITNTHSFLLVPLFYVFNFSVFIACLALHTRYGSIFLKVTFYSILASLLFQAMLSVFLFKALVLRQTLFFNNPNQLGYYGLLSATFLAVGFNYIATKPLYQGIFYVTALYITLLSLSKAAILSMFILGLILLSKRPIIVLVLASIIVPLIMVGVDTDLFSKTQARLSDIGQANDDNAEERGYDRIVNHPEYLFLGAAEGMYERFRATTHELHSTFGTILFSYGIIGTLLVFLFICQVYKMVRFRLFVYLVPAALYGLTHNGLRDTMLWMLIAFLVCLSTENAGIHTGQKSPMHHRRRLIFSTTLPLHWLTRRQSTAP